MRIRRFYLTMTMALAAAFPICAQSQLCAPVGGELMTNIGLINGVYNLGPVFGDLAGSVAAQILSQNPDGTFTVEHYWATTSGDTIVFQPAILHPTYPVTGNTNIVAVPWGNYISAISGGTGKYTNATGSLSYFGMADFTNNTLVLRYTGQVCIPKPQ
jgi:hypothetical protein